MSKKAYSGRRPRGGGGGGGLVCTQRQEQPAESGEGGGRVPTAFVWTVTKGVLGSSSGTVVVFLPSLNSALSNITSFLEKEVRVAVGLWDSSFKNAFHTLSYRFAAVILVILYSRGKGKELKDAEQGCIADTLTVTDSTYGLKTGGAAVAITPRNRKAASY